MTRLGYVVAAVALATASTGAYAASSDCKPAHEFKTLTAGKLTVAVYNYPPFSMVTTDDKISGIDVQMVQETAKANCLEVVPLNLAPAAVVQSVVSGKADVAVGAWYRSEARTKVVGLTVPTYIDPHGCSLEGRPRYGGCYEGENSRHRYGLYLEWHASKGLRRNRQDVP